MNETVSVVVVKILPVGEGILILRHDVKDAVAHLVSQLVGNGQDIQSILDLHITQKQCRAALNILACDDIETALNREKFEYINHVDITKIEINRLVHTGFKSFGGLDLRNLW